MTRYPENTPINQEHFSNCGWEQALKNAGREDYSAMWQALSDAAKQAVESRRPSEGRVLWLLADACSMMLKPESMNEPFAPFAIMSGKRSALPEDFQEDEINFITQIYSRISDHKLCARISDLAWLLAKPRNLDYALSAIDNYRRLPITMDAWVRYGRECWERAIQLCKMVGAGAGQRLQEVETALIDALINSTKPDGFLALWIAQLLTKQGLGNSDKISISNKLELLAKEFEQGEDADRARGYFDAAIIWYKRSGDEKKSSEMIFKCAECWVKEAHIRLASNSPSYMVAASFYENAIQKYRTMPKVHRDKYNADNRILELHDKMNEAGKLSLNEMGRISSGPIDISEMVNYARESVRGKEPIESLRALANIYEGARVDRIRKSSQEILSKYPLQTLFSATHISRDGRVIAKRSVGDFGEVTEEMLWADMIKHFDLELGLVVQGNIWPALEVVRQEHRLREIDFFVLSSHSPIIPHDRANLVAKALFSGYDNDFITALHILVPQLENMVRYHLKRVGVKTTNLDQDGIETENGLSTLMKNEYEKVKTIFGEDLAFEISALFCDPIGPNLRNQLAHGLIGYAESQSIHSIYAWWLMLRITFNTFWNARQNNQDHNPNA